MSVFKDEAVCLFGATIAYVCTTEAANPSPRQDQVVYVIDTF